MNALWTVVASGSVSTDDLRRFYAENPTHPADATPGDRPSGKDVDDETA